MPKYFQYISYLQYLFHIFGAYFIFTESIFKTENSLSGIGYGVFLIGVGFAVGSLSNIEKISKKEKIYFPIQKNSKNKHGHFLF